MIHHSTQLHPNLMLAFIFGERAGRMVNTRLPQSDVIGSRDGVTPA
jgi:hypothetical protein